VDHPAALDAAVDVLDADAATCHASIGGCLAAREGSAAGLAGWPDDLDLVERERQEAQVLEQPTARGSGRGRSIRHPLVVGTPRRGLTQEEDGEHGVDQQHMFDRVARFLAAIMARLLSWIVGTPDAPFGAIRPKREETGACAEAGAGGSDGCGGSCTGTTSALASGSVTLRRFASSVTDRVGASPSARRVACRTVHKT
jgi:hypothetical protein